MGRRFLWILLTTGIVILGAGAATARAGPGESAPADEVHLLLFWAENCPHCGAEKAFLDELRQRYPALVVDAREIWNNRTHFRQLQELTEAVGGTFSTPATFIGRRVWFGFDRGTAKEIELAVAECSRHGCPHTLDLAAGGLLRPGSGTQDAPDPQATSVFIPWVGRVDGEALSLPVFTLIIGLLDSFNPCAFFVLFFLLGLLVHARSRGRMLLVGGIFILFSALIYFLFMAAWLNIFLSVGRIRLVTLAAGSVAMAMAAVNIKDFFFFKQGVSLSLPEGAKPRLFQRMRGLLKATRLPSLIAGTVVLAAAANTYELLCTAGFPMVYTRVLTLHQLPTWQYYVFLSMYNLVYVIPLVIILLVVTWTLGAAHLSQWQGQVMKLLSGVMMLGLGAILLLSPALLNQVTTAVLLLAAAVVVTWVIAWGWRRHVTKPAADGGPR